MLTISFLVLALSTLALAIPAPAVIARACTPGAFTFPTIYGLKFVSLAAAPVHNYSTPPGYAANVGFPVPGAVNVDFCNVTVSYTQPGQNDLITVTVGLPLGAKAWNGRFVAAGGGGYTTGYFSSQVGALVAGYSTASTDGGHMEYALDPTWGLISPGNVNYALLEDFASLSLSEMIEIGKAITKRYYRMAPTYSYWSGCSTGGRQGLMVAQRYPHLVDGILAAAPAINWPTFLMAEYWPQQVMNRLGKYPQGCEFDAITAAAVAACDSIDGVIDGIISAPGLCNFDASTVVGKTILCPATGLNATISKAAARVAMAAWAGAQSTSGSSLWYGLDRGASLSGGLVGTTCNSNGTNCTGNPFSIPPDWMKYFVVKNADFDPSRMSYTKYDNLFQESIDQYNSIIGTDDPDLSRFRKGGGKMITFHGLADQLIFPNGTTHYYEAVEALDPEVRDFYRYYQAPGLAHCGGANGFFPTSVFQSLVDWVEKSVAPTTLEASTVFRTDGELYHRPLCQYPLVAKYVGGNTTQSSSYKCAKSF